MSSNKNTVQKDTRPPAVSIWLTGQHLIEASAGTGKTWTLTGIVLRLLIEAKRPPEQIICTTFTRAAAAEMRERIQARLQAFYQLLLWLETVINHSSNEQSHHAWLIQAKQPTADKHPSGNEANDTKQAYQDFINQREHQLKILAQNTPISEHIEDPINLHLLHYLLDRVHTFPINASVRRVQLLLISMDKLFVGTLDSLAQKWLSEYSAETGYQQGMSISNNEQELITDIIHDQIRTFQSQIYQQNPELYKLLNHSGRLTQVTDHLNTVNQATQFISAPIDELPSASFPTDFNFIKYKKLLTTVAESDYSDIHAYFSADYRKEQGMTANATLNKSFELLPNIFTAIQDYAIGFYFYLDNPTSKLFDALGDVFLHKDDGGKGFNKTKENNRQAFIALPTMQLLEQLVKMTQAMLEYMEGLIQRLNRDIALRVREQLPLMLEEQNQTSFSLQMVRLNQALRGQQGAELATYIRYHYPVALIDESQDVNGEQAKMIQSIYMLDNQQQDKTTQEKQAQTEDRRRSFLLLVGDPKQAIYGFRGGDVANYNAMKKRFTSIMSLGMNRRSNAKVIESLNVWFDSHNSRYSELGEDIFYQHIQAHRPESRLSWQANSAIEIEANSPVNNSLENNNPKSNSLEDNNSTKKHTEKSKLFGRQAVAIIHHSNEATSKDATEQPQDKFAILAQHIQQLLQSDERIDNRPITEQDIAVLVRSNSDMHKAGQAIERLGIPTVNAIERSVFSAKMAKDILAIMLAMQQPFRTSFVNRALTTSWYGLTLQQVKSWQTANQAFGQTVSQPSLSSHEPTTATESMNFSSSYADFQQYLQTAKEKWQDYGLLSALQYLLSNSPFLQHKTLTHAKNDASNIWHKLAKHKQGERYLLDLRQLLEILSTHTQGMSEQQVLDWFAEQQQQAPTEEWAKQYPIPTESGIQLMSIHKSKGLEFPIVYVLGMDSSAKKTSRAKFSFYPYIKDEQRRLSPVKTLGKTDFQAIVDKANLGEEKRIAYVALTRASEQVYILLNDHHKKLNLEFRPANIWLDCFERIYQPSERLAGYVDWIKSTDIIEANNIALPEQASKNQHITNQQVASQRADNPSHDVISQILQDSDQQQAMPVAIDYPAYNDIIKKKYFIGWSKTSFTALSRQLDKQTESVAIAEPDYALGDDYLTRNLTAELDLFHEGDVSKAETHSNATATKIATGISNDNIRFSFVRGAGAGTFLHEILEKMDFHQPNSWSQQIDKSVRQAGLPLAYASEMDKHHNHSHDNHNQATNNQHNALKQWLSDVLHSSMLASDKRLIDLPLKQRKPELAFDMGLSADFRIEQINDLFAKHLDVQGADSDKLIALTPKTGAYFYRYLRGEIDLVYEHAGKFYVVDYKSNYLGEHISDYNASNLRKAMGKAGYWLQALIYQVALHRLLRLRIPDYLGNEHNYLGAVEYLFLRGCVADGSYADNAIIKSFGKVTWDIPVNLVKDMDALLGKP